MGIIDIIQKKIRGGALTKDEIEYFVINYTNGNIADYQASALLAAICINKMNRSETIALTMAMADSGGKLDLSAIEGIKVDKHSTGGVGDKTTLVAAPLAASLGAPVLKMSGRALGFSGGTIDKMEAVNGLKIELPRERVIANVNRMKMALCAQTGVLAPADKKIYALRDVTGTVENVSLIASSIMSKKIAGGADAIVLDVKFGDGAFMKTYNDALELARLMVDIGKGVGRKTVALITGMEQPLGLAVGNSLEVREAIAALSGNGPADLREVCFSLAAYMLLLAGKTESVEDAKPLLAEVVADGRALKKLREFVEAQDGDGSLISDPEKFAKAGIVEPVESPASGYVEAISARGIGTASMNLGAGRQRKEDKIDYTAGVMLNKKIGDEVSKGEPLAWLHANDEGKIAAARELLLESYTIGRECKPKPVLIRDIVL
jgi:pyrimidine-nucleoside phosphorylase